MTIHLTPYERSILDTAITYYLSTIAPSADPLIAPMQEESRRILADIQTRLYETNRKENRSHDAPSFRRHPRLHRLGNRLILDREARPPPGQPLIHPPPLLRGRAHRPRPSPIYWTP